MIVSAQPGCWGVAARLPNNPGSQKLTPFSSAKEIAGSEATAPSASAALVAKESRADRNRLLPFCGVIFGHRPPRESCLNDCSQRSQPTQTQDKYLVAKDAQRCKFAQPRLSLPNQLMPLT